MNVAKHGTFGEAVARAELVGVTYRGVGAVTLAKVRLVLQSTHFFGVWIAEVTAPVLVRLAARTRRRSPDYRQIKGMPARTHFTWEVECV